MIFLTVGSQMPFDRLVGAVDQWLTSGKISEQVVAQVGQSQINARHLNICAQLSPIDFITHCKNARFMIGHAGMGSILTALEHGKPIVVMPRKGTLHETRNDHQVAAGDWLRTIEGVYFAEDEQALGAALDKAMAHTGLQKKISAKASTELLQGLRKFVNQMGDDH